MKRVVSVSGGKDSTATLLLAIERHPRDEIVSVFADTGNEHPETYNYIDYLESELGISIQRIKRDFSEWIARRRIYIRDKWPEKGVPQDVVERALEYMYPTGNPFLDLCLIKARFPSPKVRFCTQYLKTEPLTEHHLKLVSEYGKIESWQGIRADESAARSKLPEREHLDENIEVYRPILTWTAEEVFAYIKEKGLKPNPLYLQGMARVGCMPCINSRKSEIREIARRFPEQIKRISEWEKLVGMISKRSSATFFPSLGENEDAYERGNVWKKVEWSNDTRSNNLLFIDEDINECQSSYGLCE